MDRPGPLCLPQLVRGRRLSQTVHSLCCTQKSELVWVKGLWGNLGTHLVQRLVYLLGSRQQMIPFLEQPFLTPD